MLQHYHWFPMGLKYSAWRRAHTDNIALFALCYNLQVMKTRQCYVTKKWFRKKVLLLKNGTPNYLMFDVLEPKQSLFQSANLPTNYIKSISDHKITKSNFVLIFRYYIYFINLFLLLLHTRKTWEISRLECIKCLSIPSRRSFMCIVDVNTIKYRCNISKEGKITCKKIEISDL